eukprot:CAMPEP_0114686054 /NCGR_PEP_ID=MMETSP0191-20121206/61102_1 /TAXON_ID=126664 /ORGANISM="Sorites sp." /LENGTH=68 /DNA_ID=CAMNT_0001971169 /DNA_START=18 /DNA_END=220 /DNA_ORIENTATION=+
MTDVEGVGGSGKSTFNLCPTNTHVQAYVYDIRPDNFDVNPSDPGIGAKRIIPITGTTPELSCDNANCT